MKKLLMTLAAAVLAFSGAKAEEYPDISIADLKKAIAEKKVVILDVNGSESYKEGHIPGAIDFTSSKADLASKLPKEKDALVVAYCGGPACSAYKSAAAKAKELGYTNVKHLSAGISGWTKAGEKTEAASETKKEEKKDSKKESKLVATVDGVVCGACRKKVEAAFVSIGASNVKVEATDKEGVAKVTASSNGDVCKESLTKALGEFKLASLEAVK